MIRLKIAIELTYEIADNADDFLFSMQPVAKAADAGLKPLGFSPVFLDFDTFTIYPSRFADGRPAPLHLLDGLPDEVVIDRGPSGRPVAAKATLISGFERSGFFYTRRAAANAAHEWARPQGPTIPAW